MKDKIYKCLDCNKEIREKAVTISLKDLRLCPQCYTKRKIICKD